MAIARPWRKLSGVYFLIDVGRIVYVGQSTNISSRVGQHCADKTFTSWASIECPEDFRLTLERFYIKKFDPPLNRVGR